MEYTPSTITLIPKFKASSHLLRLFSPVVLDLAGASKDMLSPDVAHSFSGFYSKTNIMSTC